ncbi:MAG: RlmE family RNA methyltransferase [Candidatus Thorarchaeota archaeon]|nr:RlmE family RNA methyltransferase [Candidatus Thorarchaeota archaeon]
MGRRRRDEHYYQKAKKEGYRSRSAYKLKQIVKKFKLLRGVDIVLELCSSPGGWTQVLRELDPSLEVVAVDIEKMIPVMGVRFIQGDIRAEETQQKIDDFTRGKADLVLSDCSPKVCGNWNIDVARQLELAETTFNIAHRLDSNKALAKVFEGPGFEEFKKRIEQKFATTRLIKPDASRKSSSELYLLASNPR